jgi:hypothetical protein
MSSAQSPTDETLDETFTVLRNARRRWTMHVLAEHGSLDRSELADRVAEIEYDRPIEDISGDDRHVVYVSLQQTHLDALEDADVIRRDGNTILKGDRFGEVYRWIQPEESFTERVKQALLR